MRRINYLSGWEERKARLADEAARATDTPKVLRISRTIDGGWNVYVEPTARMSTMRALGLRYSQGGGTLNGHISTTPYHIPASACDENGKVKDPKLAAFLRENYHPVPPIFPSRTTRRTSR